MSARVVLDASATLALLFHEASARSIADAIAEADWVAPLLWRLEVVNALLVRERRKELTPAQTGHLLEQADGLGVECLPEPPDRPLAYIAEFARPHQLTAYDAAYLDLAVRLAAPLLTVDRNLRSAAKRLGVQLAG